MCRRSRTAADADPIHRRDSADQAAHHAASYLVGTLPAVRPGAQHASVADVAWARSRRHPAGSAGSGPGGVAARAIQRAHGEDLPDSEAGLWLVADFGRAVATARSRGQQAARTIRRTAGADPPERCRLRRRNFLVCRCGRLLAVGLHDAHEHGLSDCRQSRIVRAVTTNSSVANTSASSITCKRSSDNASSPR